jgi:5-methylcytosine-specific restriction endonuclease McrA
MDPIRTTVRQGNYHTKPTPEKSCALCGCKMERRRFASGVLEDLTSFTKRKLCSRKCKDASVVKEVVSENQYRYRARRMRKPQCEQCGSVSKLQVHHIDKDVSNNTPMNLQTLCASCHNTLHWKDRKANGN